MVERDIFEVANQLAGYVDEGTPERLAQFLMRESGEAEKLAHRITTLAAEVERLKAGNADLVKAVGEHITVRSELRAEVEQLRKGLYQARNERANLADNVHRLETDARAEASAAVKVKALDWIDEEWALFAFPAIGKYRIEDQGKNWTSDRFWASFDGEIIGKFDDYEPAKAAAQADYERRILSALTTEPAAAQEAPSEQCDRCQGNGEIVTDWERYRHPYEGDKGDEAVAECPDCNGEGRIDIPAAPQEAETTSNDPISRAEMVELFGEAMPAEAVNLLWSAPDDWTCADVRRELRRIASTRTQEADGLANELIALGNEIAPTHGENAQAVCDKAAAILASDARDTNSVVSHDAANLEDNVPQEAEAVAWVRPEVIAKLTDGRAAHHVDLSKVRGGGFTEPLYTTPPAQAVTEALRVLVKDVRIWMHIHYGTSKPSWAVTSLDAAEAALTAAQEAGR